MRNEHATTLPVDLANICTGAVLTAWWQRIVKTLSLAHEAMEKHIANADLHAPSRVEIRLWLTDDRGARWSVSMSPGTERFIGRYPRLDEFAHDAQFLRYQSS